MSLIKSIESVDVLFGAKYGDEGKGKICNGVSDSEIKTYYLENKDALDKSSYITDFIDGLLGKKYDFVCRWAGGDNAGHTFFVNDKEIKTSLIPAGVFHNIKSIIGPNCVVNISTFFKEIKMIEENGFDPSLVKISPKAHIITKEHLEIDIENKKKYGSTGKGITPCYTDKIKRVGIRAKDCEELKDYLWDEELYGNILCEGAQGFYLDIDYGNYPYVTSSTTLPYGACSLGFPPQKIDRIIGCSKIYDTRVGYDPDFPKSLLEDEELSQIGEVGHEFGTVTGRKRVVNYENLDKLIYSLNVSGATDLIISKCDILEKVGVYKLYYKDELYVFDSLVLMKEFIVDKIKSSCEMIKNIIFSSSPKFI